jgi:phosphoribosylcarboxyaminoimidazole (NCAIR) mutase
MIFHPGHIIVATTGSYDMTDILNITAATTGQCVIVVPMLTTHAHHTNVSSVLQPPQLVNVALL